MKRNPSATFLVFIIGFICYLVFMIQIRSTFLLSGIELYFLLMVLTAINLTAPLMGEDSPTSKIIRIVSVNKSTAYKTLIQSFTNKEFIDRKLQTLLVSRAVIKRGNRFYVTPKGQRIDAIIEKYQHLIAWDKGG